MKNSDIKISKIETYFDVQNGVRLWQDIDKYKSNMNILSDGRYYQLTEKIQNQRSREQNNALWAIPYAYMLPALIITGNLPEHAGKMVCHEWCMVNCLPLNYRERIYEEWKQEPGIVNIKTGEVYKQAFRLTTTKMKTNDCNQYYKNMQDLYAENFSSGEQDDLIPEPRKDWKDNKDVK
jgi:hypothetical protein